MDKRQKGRIVVLLVMMIIGAFLEVLSVGLLVPLVTAMMQPDIVTTNRYASVFCQFFGIKDNWELLIVCLIALVIIFVLKNIYPKIPRNYTQVTGRPCIDP